VLANIAHDRTVILERAFAAADQLWATIPSVAKELVHAPSSASPLSAHALKTLYVIGAIPCPAQHTGNTLDDTRGAGVSMDRRIEAAERVALIMNLPEHDLSHENFERVRNQAFGWLSVPYKCDVTGELFKALASACIQVPDTQASSYSSIDQKLRHCFHHLSLGASDQQIGLLSKFFIWTALRAPEIEFTPLMGELGKALVQISADSRDLNVEDKLRELCQLHPKPKSIFESLGAALSRAPIAEGAAIAGVTGIGTYLVAPSLDPLIIGFSTGAAVTGLFAVIEVGREFLRRAYHVRRYNLLSQLTQVAAEKS
jgi:hypothetical protein